MGFKFKGNPEDYIKDFPIEDMIKAFSEYGYTFNNDEQCNHKRIVLVYTQGKYNGNTFEKDFLVRCSDCEEELYRVGMIGREIINLLPD
ncbi:hypothetical protein ABE073_04620 [Lederbergia citrisecunda]|uniref:hypothetical protein n=1 Tax=Lederbergia citrisecunda TaxID=2833583 RepID=UPI003D2A862A